MADGFQQDEVTELFNFDFKIMLDRKDDDKEES